jgi:hypothetical protein
MLVAPERSGAPMLGSGDSYGHLTGSATMRRCEIRPKLSSSFDGIGASP